MIEDEKDFEEWLLRKYPEAKYWSFRTLKIKDMELAWCEARRTLREKKIKTRAEMDDGGPSYE